MYEVLSVEGTSAWNSANGPMTQWSIWVRDQGTGEEFLADINSKAQGGKNYAQGDVFDGYIDREHNGVPQLKRTQQQRGGGGYGGNQQQPQQRQAPAQNQRQQPQMRTTQAQRIPAGNPQPQQASRGTGKPFAQALAVHQAIADQVSKAAAKNGFASEEVVGGWITSFFLGWLRGEIQAPAAAPDQQQRRQTQDDVDPDPGNEDPDDQIPF